MPSIRIATVLCVVMREPRVRLLDTVHPGCRFFDVTGATAQWAGRTVQLPCSKYSPTCYTKKLSVLFSEMLAEPHDAFYYVEADHTKCASRKMISQFAQTYLGDQAELITTGIGASGWLFTRRWANAFIEAATKCNEWCYCPDCIAALLPLPRSTTRVVLTQHSVVSRQGLNQNTNHLPRCFEQRVESGMNKFDFFDHKKCKTKDISPCFGAGNLLAGH